MWYEGTSLADKRWLIADELGSVVAVTSETGAVLQHNRYDDYGKPHEDNLGRFQYTGQMWLDEAQVHHYKARAYDPQTGRFLQTDPIGYADGMNLYAYVGNNPINRIDPWGLYDIGEDPEEIVITGRKLPSPGGIFSVSPSFSFPNIGFAGSANSSTAAGITSAAEASACGDGGNQVDSFGDAAQQILPEGTQGDVANLGRALSSAYGESARVLRAYNSGYQRNRYAGNDVGAYVFAGRGGYYSPTGPAHPGINPPFGFGTGTGLAPHRRPSGIVATVVAPNPYLYPGYAPRGHESLSRLQSQSRQYRATARATEAPVVAKAGDTICVY